LQACLWESTTVGHWSLLVVWIYHKKFQNFGIRSLATDTRYRQNRPKFGLCWNLAKFGTIVELRQKWPDSDEGFRNLVRIWQRSSESDEGRQNLTKLDFGETGRNLASTAEIRWKWLKSCRPVIESRHR
jgi:hypothetical protein